MKGDIGFDTVEVIISSTVRHNRLRNRWMVVVDGRSLCSTIRCGDVRRCRSRRPICGWRACDWAHCRRCSLRHRTQRVRGLTRFRGCPIYVSACLTYCFGKAWGIHSELPGSSWRQLERRKFIWSYSEGSASGERRRHAISREDWSSSVWCPSSIEWSVEMVFFRGRETMASTPPTTMRVERGEDPASMLESDFAVFEGILTVFVAVVWRLLPSTRL